MCLCHVIFEQLPSALDSLLTGPLASYWRRVESTYFVHICSDPDLVQVVSIMSAVQS
jgi:hypothetical protein